MRRHYAWNINSNNVTSELVQDGTLLSPCTETTHYFRHANCQCLKYNLTNVRIVLAKKVADAETK